MIKETCKRDRLLGFHHIVLSTSYCKSNLIEYDPSRNHKSCMEAESRLSDRAVEQSGEGPGYQPGRLFRSATTEKSGEGPGNQPGRISWIFVISTFVSRSRGLRDNECRLYMKLLWNSTLFFDVTSVGNRCSTAVSFPLLLCTFFTSQMWDYSHVISVTSFILQMQHNTDFLVVNCCGTVE